MSSLVRGDSALPYPLILHMEVIGQDNSYIVSSQGEDEVFVFDTDRSVINTENGDDYVFMAGHGQDLFLLGGGNDTFNGASALDGQRVSGGEGNDSLIGGRGADTLDGGTGHDTLVGNAGNDTLFVHAGDVVTGGSGADRFVFAPSPGEHGRAVIDYHPGEGDQLDLGHMPYGTEAIALGHELLFVNRALGIFVDVHSAGDSFGLWASYHMAGQSDGYF